VRLSVIHEQTKTWRRNQNVKSLWDEGQLDCDSSYGHPDSFVAGDFCHFSLLFEMEASDSMGSVLPLY